MTSLNENIAVAWTSIGANKMRSVLTMLGIIIGITAVITIVSIGSGQGKQMQDQMNNQGFANINVRAKQKQGSEKNDDVPIVIDMDLLREVYDTYADQCKGVSLASDMQYVNENWQDDYVKSKKDTLKTCFMLVNQGYWLTGTYEFLYGSPITPTEYQNGSRVIILTDKAAKVLFGTVNENCIGQTVETYCNNIYSSFTVKGILHETDQMKGGWYEDTMTGKIMIAPYSYIPLKAYESLTGKPQTFSECSIIPDSGKGADAILELVENIKTDMNAKAGDYIEYDVSSYIDYIQQSAATMRNQFLVTALVAAIALIVGGIGVMNIMMVSITERTKEIGTRKALGATNSSLLLQFIIEAILLCLIGGVIGIILGIIGGIIACNVMKLPYVLEPLSILISVVFSLFIGSFFGYYPASRAAKMDPIEALRYE